MLEGTKIILSVVYINIALASIYEIYIDQRVRER